MNPTPTDTKKLFQSFVTDIANAIIFSYKWMKNNT